MMQSTSPRWLSRPYSAVITSYPSARSAGISLLKHEPSAQIPWQKTMLLIGDTICSLLDRNTATGHGAPSCCTGAAKALQNNRVSGAIDVRQRGVQAL